MTNPLIDALSNHETDEDMLSSVKKLIEEKHQNVNKQNGFGGETALHMAVAKNNLATVNYLIKKGANVDIAASYYQSAVPYAYRDLVPLHVAVMKNNLAIAKVLLDAGIHTVNYKNGVGQTKHKNGTGKKPSELSEATPEMKTLIRNHSIIYKCMPPDLFPSLFFKKDKWKSDFIEMINENNKIASPIRNNNN